MEKIKLEDYLYFYPNVPILIYDGDDPVPAYVEGFDFHLNKVIAERTTYEYSQIKPILRNIVDMTNEEMKELSDFGKEWFGGIKNLNYADVMKVKWLLSKGFDLFSLIDAGLAVRRVDFENKPKLPKTFEEAVDYLIPQFDGMEELKTMDEDEFAVFCHSMMSGGIGMQIRNQLGFWTQDSEIYKHMNDVMKIDHPDDMSNAIVKGVYKKINKK